MGDMKDRSTRPRPRLYLAEWRKYRGLTQEELADRIGISRVHVSRIEKGHSPWDQTFLGAVSEALGCGPVDLLTRDPAGEPGIWDVWNSMNPTEQAQALMVLQAIKGAPK